MTEFVASPSAGGLVKLHGCINAYKCRRSHASFVFAESDRTAMGVIAVAAATAGLGGLAMGTAASASAMEEEADYVEFQLDGRPVKGWVWRSPFKDGDVVDVAAEWQNDHYEAFGIARPKDRMIALYPHCSRGRLRHVRNAIKWWAVSGGIWVALLYLGGYWMGGYHAVSGVEAPIASLCSLAFFALMTWSLTRKWMPFVRLAERVFRTLDWANSGNVDLVRSSKAQRTDRDSSEYGTFYFRY